MDRGEQDMDLASGCVVMSLAWFPIPSLYLGPGLFSMFAWVNTIVSVTQKSQRVHAHSPMYIKISMNKIDFMVVVTNKFKICGVPETQEGRYYCWTLTGVFYRMVSCLQRVRVALLCFCSIQTG